MIKSAIKTTSAGFATLIFASGIAIAQTVPLPQASPPQTKESGQQNIVVNPTDAECATGWNANLKWSRAQFDEFCATLSKSK